MQCMMNCLPQNRKRRNKHLPVYRAVYKHIKRPKKKALVVFIRKKPRNKQTSERVICLLRDHVLWGFRIKYSDKPPIHVHSSRSSVPAVSSASPIPDLSESFSLNTIRENSTVTSMLSLSIGATMLAGPSWSAL